MPYHSLNIYEDSFPAVPGLHWQRAAQIAFDSLDSREQGLVARTIHDLPLMLRKRGADTRVQRLRGRDPLFLVWSTDRLRLLLRQTGRVQFDILDIVPVERLQAFAEFY